MRLAVTVMALLLFWQPPGDFGDAKQAFQEALGAKDEGRIVEAIRSLAGTDNPRVRVPGLSIQPSDTQVGLLHYTCIVTGWTRAGA